MTRFVARSGDSIVALLTVIVYFCFCEACLTGASGHLNLLHLHKKKKPKRQTEEIPVAFVIVTIKILMFADL